MELNKRQFYDADGNTLFDIENDRLKEEYEAMDFSASEPQSEMGKAISNIEQQAFEQAVIRQQAVF